MTSRSSGLPSRQILSRALDPGDSSAIRARSCGTSGVGLPPISGGSDAVIPGQGVNEVAKKAVPPEDLEAAPNDPNQKPSYARHLGDGMRAGGEVPGGAAEHSRRKRTRRPSYCG